MSITLTPSPSTGTLVLTGDLACSIAIPSPRTVIALSEGTLLEICVEDSGLAEIYVNREGAARIPPKNGGVRVEWPVEWIAVAPAHQTLLIEHQAEPLPLFPEVA